MSRALPADLGTASVQIWHVSSPRATFALSDSLVVTLRTANCLGEDWGDAWERCEPCRARGRWHYQRQTIAGDRYDIVGSPGDTTGKNGERCYGAL